MNKLGNLNTLTDAATWLAKALRDSGLTPGYLIELGREGVLELYAAIPKEYLVHPADGKSFGLDVAFWNAGMVKLDHLDCQELQAQGNIKRMSVESEFGQRQLSSMVTITLHQLRVKREALERFAAIQNTQHDSETSEDSIDAEIFQSAEENKPEPQTDPHRTKTPAGPSITATGVESKLIIERFRLSEEWAEKLRKPDRYKYVLPALVIRGKAGGGGHRWNPVAFGRILIQRKVRNLAAVTAVINRQFSDWADEWEGYADSDKGAFPT